MKRMLSATVFSMALFGATACGSGGSGCGGGETEESLDQQTQSATQQVTTTCGPGTHLEGSTCVRNAQAQTQRATTLGN